MMDYSTFWEVAVGIAGLGAIGAFVFWSLYKKWLTLRIFANLTEKQTFQLMRLFLVFSFFFAVIALGVYAYTETLSTDKTDNITVNQVMNGDSGVQVPVNEGTININLPDQTNQESGQ